MSIVVKKIKSLKKRVRLMKIWGSFRRLKPFSDIFGYDRGSQSIARYYIDEFVKKNSNLIYGNVLEVGDNKYTRRYGSEVSISDVLHIEKGNPQATIVADLTCADNIQSNIYDCFILTQTLQCIYDFKSALKNAHRILKPGGCLLVTHSGISQISRYDMDRWGDYWRFTSLSTRKVFEEFFPPNKVKIETCGNVLSAMAFIEGLASKELKKKELDYHDPNYEVIITVCAIKE